MATGAAQFEYVAPSILGHARSFDARHRSAVWLSLLVLSFLVVALTPWLFVSVPAGHLGVMWHRVAGGTDTGKPYGEGLHLLLPWNRMEIYDARLQQANRDFEVLTQDGMALTVNIAWQFRIREDAAGLLHKYVGPNYTEILVAPAVGSYARHAFSRFGTEDAYALRRADVQAEIRDGVADELARAIGRRQGQGAPWVLLEGVLIRGMRFPPEVAAAVNRKMEQQQLRQEYAYRLERERLESERKEVEADGIARFQRVVGAGISENYLRWRGIDATLALAQSANAKVVIIGTPRDGMPLILGGSDAAGATAAPREQGAGPRRDPAEPPRESPAAGTPPGPPDPRGP